jgi:hypothetical protein
MGCQRRIFAVYIHKGCFRLQNQNDVLIWHINCMQNQRYNQFVSYCAA